MNTKLHTYTRQVYADQITPIGVYLNVRGLFAESILLESSEMDDKRNGRSIICAKPIAGISLDANHLTKYYKDSRTAIPTAEMGDIRLAIKSFVKSFELEGSQLGINGCFGYQSFEAVRYFETPKANLCPEHNTNFAILDYRVYQYVVCFNHFNGELSFIENTEPDEPCTLDSFMSDVLTKRSGSYPFKLKSEEATTYSDEVFLDKIKQAQAHCKRGDVFQMVLSRQFQRSFNGDEFNVYRALRHINPSPYMFFFDYGHYKIFGSSPEAQIKINQSEALINPIAGTYRRTGNKDDDALLAQQLYNDAKESAEHAMLVDLARNDLNRHCHSVEVEEYKTVKQYSHVIHLVSTVKGQLYHADNGINILADTFPAGTLSGAPKVRAIQLLADIEASPRHFYGGSIGFIDFNGDINQAIIIRSFLTHNNTIYYRAGAGIVLKSNPQSELEEINNKLAALRKALHEAQNL